MNRLVIIGNGFDLAHGLPTSYKDFIDDFWKNLRINYNNEDYRKIITLNDKFDGYYLGYKSIERFDDVKSNLIEYCNDYKYRFDVDNFRAFSSSKSDREVIFQFKSNFFKIINLKNSKINWVDIENEYYRELKKIVNSTYKSTEEKENLAKKLNQEFEEIKKLLEVYLFKTFDELYKFEDILKLDIVEHLKSKPNSKDFLFEKKDKEFYKIKDNIDLKETLLLSFNYTKTVLDYSNFLSDKHINTGYNYIHGKINTDELPMIFGFGDEMDDDYRLIENIDDNEYLKNFKSIQYLENSTYKRFYDFIESEPYQVFVFGHSCGLSDRTLLSTIFENENCLSIKVFYHQKAVEIDNYKEVIQNISRHFSDKKMLRKKVVEKRHCQPLIKFVDKDNVSQS